MKIESFREKLLKGGWISTQDAATRLGLNRATIYRWIKDGRVQSSEINGIYFVSLESIRSLLGRDLSTAVGL